MILIADSGSSKCSWAECSKNGEIIQMHQTVGFNPKYTSEKSLLNTLKSSTLNEIKDKVTEIHFYGAGCSAPARNSVLEKPMQAFFQYAKIHFKHDLEAAVKATYKGNPIICSIIGTGSNSCFYDGKTITENTPSLGYIFGDEARGNYFGKQLINLYINKALPKEIVAKFENWTPERADDTIENIYDLEKPNLYLASFFSLCMKINKKKFLILFSEKAYSTFLICTLNVLIIISNTLSPL